VSSTPGSTQEPGTFAGRGETELEYVGTLNAGSLFDKLTARQAAPVTPRQAVQRSLYARKNVDDETTTSPSPELG